VVHMAAGSGVVWSALRWPVRRRRRGAGAQHPSPSTLVLPLVWAGFRTIVNFTGLVTLFGLDVEYRPIARIDLKFVLHAAGYQFDFIHCRPTFILQPHLMYARSRETGERCLLSLVRIDSGRGLGGHLLVAYI
jgi:hypothetical protein